MTLTEQELEVLYYLTQAGSKFQELEEWHGSEHFDMLHLLSMARAILMARPTALHMKAEAEAQEAGEPKEGNGIVTPDTTIHTP